MYNWKVVPLCKEQLLDIDPKDVLPGGEFRLCDVYKSGGGYDKFPAIFEKRTGRKTSAKQFVVQLYGCHLKCPYCYVTPNGIWGKPVYYHTDALAKVFFTAQKLLRDKFSVDVFHLMGGSPGLYLKHWPELIERLGEDVVFHSDLCLTEKPYDDAVLRQIAKPNCLYAVNFKGITIDNYKKNTGLDDQNNFRTIGIEMMANFSRLVENEVPFYVTFTNPDKDRLADFCEGITNWWGKSVLEDMIVIDVVDYDAVKAYNCSKGEKHDRCLQI